MKRTASVLMGLVWLIACQPAATTSTNAAATGAPNFNVAALSQSDIAIQGCTTTLNRVGSADMIFAEDGVDTGAKGFIRIDGQLIGVELTSATGDEKHATRNFADTNHSVDIVESLTTGAAHEESDSVEQAGALAITYKGATQTIPVEGGTAC